jgi:hypothetical protein
MPQRIRAKVVERAVRELDHGLTTLDQFRQIADIICYELARAEAVVRYEPTSEETKELLFSAFRAARTTQGRREREAVEPHDAEQSVGL